MAAKLFSYNITVNLRLGNWKYAVLPPLITRYPSKPLGILKDATKGEGKLGRETLMVVAVAAEADRVV